MEESELTVPFKTITGCSIADGQREEMETSVEATDKDQRNVVVQMESMMIHELYL